MLQVLENTSFQSDDEQRKSPDQRVKDLRLSLLQFFSTQLKDASMTVICVYARNFLCLFQAINDPAMSYKHYQDLSVGALGVLAASCCYYKHNNHHHLKR